MMDHFLRIVHGPGPPPLWLEAKLYPRRTVLLASSAKPKLLGGSARPLSHTHTTTKLQVMAHRGLGILGTLSSTRRADPTERTDVTIAP